MVSCPVGPSGQRVPCVMLGPSTTDGFFMVRHYAVVTHVHASQIHMLSDSDLTEQLMDPTAHVLPDDFDLMACLMADDDDNALMLEHGMVEHPNSDEPDCDDDFKLFAMDACMFGADATVDSDESEADEQAGAAHAGQTPVSQDASDVVFIKSIPGAQSQHEKTHAKDAEARPDLIYLV